jgi:asparagine synthase (glutamine-hydrolysing)
MCGIWALIEKDNSDNDIAKYLADFWNLKHRGPENSYFQTFSQTYVGFHRLPIMDNSFKSNQPYLINDGDRTIVFICNGEIYNYQELDKKFNLNVGTSDCLVIPKLYIQNSVDDFIDLFKYKREYDTNIKGEYAFVLFEFDNMKQLTKYIVGRDMIGVRPLYTVKNSRTIDMYSSEIKGMTSYDGDVMEFQPGTIRIVSKNVFDYTITDHDINNYLYNISGHKCDINYFPIDYYLKEIRNSVTNSIRRRLHADRPIAFLLSGGVDSSLVASISAKILGKQIRTFCCGIKGSTDMKYAKMVADHIGSNHTEVYFTEEEGLDTINDVVRTTETWDTTTIRASVGQYLVCKYISEHTDCKVVMVGEGPDEVCSSYLFNYYAPDGKALDETAKEYVKNIHLYDGRRADRCIARWGLEGRIAFLDPEFISTYWRIDPDQRLPSTHNMEKYLLRKAFDGLNLLPNQVLWRKKEAFSDGVSSTERSWYTMIQDYISTKYTEEMDKLEGDTKEARYFKNLFINHFGTKRLNIIPGYWQPKWDKDGKEISRYVDPSARTLDIY